MEMLKIGILKGGNLEDDINSILKNKRTFDGIENIVINCIYETDITRADFLVIVEEFSAERIFVCWDTETGLLALDSNDIKKLFMMVSVENYNLKIPLRWDIITILPDILGIKSANIH